ncbi:putative low affinity copper uptake protein 2 [Lonchura striata]|uniref:Copper transport protein n=1 Tax=Lonchura striata TaxID=40157 RepID=A0A218U9I9_9PASE|nr:putative low affinity copper uptake protein 2 [Lonchura striata domestica]
MVLLVSGVSPAGMVLSVLLILLLAVLYEAVKMGKAVLLRRALLALPRSLSQEALTEPREGDSDPAQGSLIDFGAGFPPELSSVAPTPSLLPKLPFQAPGGRRFQLPQPLGDGISHLFPRWFWFHVGQTLFHVVQVVLGYMVMLAVMSYNAWIFLGAIAGSTLGYFMVYPLLGRG